MRKDMREVFADKLKVLKQIKGKKNREKYIEELNEFANMYCIAKDFKYPKHILNSIANAKTLIEAENILINARRNYL